MNKNIDPAVYERYIDAATALFMEYYSSEMGESIRKEMEEGKIESIAFPKDLDDRCRALIEKECTIRHRKNLWSGLAKGLRYAASFVIILLAAASILFVSVEAVRIPIIDYYVERSEGYWVISQGSPSDGIDHNDPEVFDVSDPLAGLLPAEYHLVMSDGDSVNQLVAIYEKSPGCEVFFSTASSDSSAQIDSEGAQTSQVYQISGKDVVLVIEDATSRIAWIDEDFSTTFTLIATDMSSDDLLSIAEQLIENISK